LAVLARRGGHHGYEYWLTLGNLFQDITGEEAAWQSRH
jgi:hypothetical protein